MEYLRKYRYDPYVRDAVKRKRRRLEKNEDSDDDSEAPAFPFPLPGILGGEEKKRDKKIFRTNNHIYFRDRVNMDSVNKLCNLIEEINEEYEDYNNTKVGYVIPKPIYVHICSLGGDLFAGFMGYDYIKNSRIPVYTVAEGHTVSAASLMYMGGKRRFMTESGYMLIHQLRGGVQGTHAEIEDEYENCTSLMTRIKSTYLDNLNRKGNKMKLLTEEDLSEQLKKDLFWGFEECMEKGLCHELFTNAQERDSIDKEAVLRGIHPDLRNTVA